MALPKDWISTTKRFEAIWRKLAIKEARYLGIIWSDTKEFARSYFYTQNFVEAQGNQAISEAIDIAEAKTIRSKRSKMDNFTIYDAAPTHAQKRWCYMFGKAGKKLGVLSCCRLAQQLIRKMKIFTKLVSRRTATTMLHHIRLATNINSQHGKL